MYHATHIHSTRELYTPHNRVLNPPKFSESPPKLDPSRGMSKHCKCNHAIKMSVEIYLISSKSLLIYRIADRLVTVKCTV